MAVVHNTDSYPYPKGSRWWKDEQDFHADQYPNRNPGTLVDDSGQYISHPAIRLMTGMDLDADGLSGIGVFRQEYVAGYEDYILPDLFPFFDHGVDVEVKYVDLREAVETLEAEYNVIPAGPGQEAAQNTKQDQIDEAKKIYDAAKRVDLIDVLKLRFPKRFFARGSERSNEFQPYVKHFFDSKPEFPMMGGLPYAMQIIDQTVETYRNQPPAGMEERFADFTGTTSIQLLNFQEFVGVFSAVHSTPTL